MSLNLKNIHRIDRENMLENLLDFPLQCQMALGIADQIEFNLKRKFNKVIFSGMGGSAIGGDLVRSYLYKELDLPIMVFREYNLPASLDRESLVFICSYSGNTEETLSSYAEAKQKDATIIAISSGGKLKDLCFNNKDIFIQIPSGLPPRCALGYLSLIPLRILERIGIIKERQDEYKELILVLDDLKKNHLNPSVAKQENIAKYLALKIYNKLAILYSPSLYFDVVAARFRAQLNENAKTLAISNLLPEMNHNEIEGYLNLKRLFKHLVVIFLKDDKIHPQVKKRIEITSQIIKEKGISVFEVNAKGVYLLARIFSLIYIADFISFYLAILYNIDPTPVKVISTLKQRLKE
jgi:glucose/mannose-6-phosphate isomerase